VVSFGASITSGVGLKDPNNNWAKIIARELGIHCINQARVGAANGEISRRICSYPDYKNDLILAMWTSPTRYEFRTDNDWQEINGMMKPTEFSRAWYRGPGLYQYTEITTTIKEILLSQCFLQNHGLDYLFVFDNDDITKCWLSQNPDVYIKNLLDLIDWSKTIWFDDTGFLQWSQTNNFEFIDEHPSDHAHRSAANYILSKRCFTASNTNALPYSL
jgi:hypothetical protein